MANQKVTQLTLISIAQVTDLLYLVTFDADGVPTSVAMSVDNLLASTLTGVNRIISGQVVWTGVGFIHRSINLAYELNGVIYFSNNEDITNSAPDGSNPRFDVIFVDADGLDIKEGTPAASPTVPSLDNPTLEIATNIVLVTNGETTPTGVTLETVYSENLQESGGEWDTFENSSGARIVLANTDDPINLTKDIKADAPIADDYLKFNNTTPIAIADFQNLRNTFRSISPWKQDYFRIVFYDGATEVGSVILNRTMLDTLDDEADEESYISKDMVTWVAGETQFDEIRHVWVDAGGATPVSNVRVQIDLIFIEWGGITTTTKVSNFIYISPEDFTGTDTEKIQQAVDAAAGDDRYVYIFKKDSSNTPWDIEEAITLGSDTSIIIDGAILQLTDTSRDNFFRTENCGLGFTSPYDELENIHILGIKGATLKGADNPRATGDSGKTLINTGADNWDESYGSDTGVGGETQTGDWRNFGILFAYTTRYSVRGLLFDNMHGWAISNERCTTGRFENLNYACYAERTIPSVGIRYIRNNDGIDILFGCTDMIVRDIAGHTDDDTVAVGLIQSTDGEGVYGTRFVTGGTYSSPSDDIHDVIIKDISTSTQAHNVRLLNKDGSLLYNISIQNITDLLTVDDIDGVGAVIVIGSTSYGPSSALGELYNVSIDNIKNGHKPYAVLISGGLADSNISNIIDYSTMNNDYPVYFDASGVGARNVQLSNIFKTDEANDLAAWYDGVPAVRIGLKADFTSEDLEITGNLRILDGNLLLRNVADTFSGIFTNTNTADRTYTLPDATGILMLLELAQTVSGAKTFEDAKLLLRNVADTFSSKFTNTNTAARTYTLPDASGTVLMNVVEDTTPQAGGEFDLQANSIGGTVQTATGDGTTTIDWKDGNMFDFQFGAFNETFTFTAPTKPGTFILKLVQDGVGSRTVTWPGTVKWVGGTAPTLTTTATTGTDIITFYYNGTSYFAVQSLDFS